MTRYRVVWLVAGGVVKELDTYATMIEAVCHGLKTCDLCNLNPSTFTTEATNG